ncbi:4-coumarate--CoA ligase-like 9 [Citrus sinensis]|uniref:4-coumarate--CoA ligase-like 9 n=1 Tax=Citrus sinensis TaxID=2711 RepID=A0ACB8LTJ3_CITSI|nr:4-coumarate--CoA ligase-like 9 [Citrus sinensis]
MAGTNSNGLIDPNSGFCSQTKTFHSVRPKIPLPPSSQPLSVTQFTLSLLHKSATTTAAPFLMNAATGRRLTYPEFLRQTNSLTLSLQKHYSLSKNDVAFILSPSSFEIPVLYFSLLSLGVVVSPANPLGSTSEISHQLHLSKPSIAFATSRTSHKLPPNIRTVLVDSPEFLSLLSTQNQNDVVISPPAVVNQSDAAVLLYSSGTTGKVKGVLLTHRNIISLVASFHHVEYGANPAEPQPSGEVSLITLPLFHVFGFLALVRVVAVSETAVFMERFDFETMLKTVDKYKLTSMPVSPPLVVALTKSELTKKYDLSSLQYLSCGGAPLGKEVTDKFKEKFPSVEIIQGYGLTECGGLASSMRDSEETKRHGSVGRLHELMEAKIVDPVTGDALSPGQKGELWLRGPTIMKGYIGDNKATIETVDSEGWLKTGDLCYFDSNGFLFIVDRLKELIKYKAYQIPPAELEHLLQSNPEIADAAVIPYPDEEAGQIPMAFVVAPYKKIRRVAFVNSIPKSEAGKILRRELVNHALSGNLSKL